MAEAMSEYAANEIDSWWSDAPITGRQLDVIQGDLDNKLLPEGWRVHPQVVRKLVAETKRLRAQLAEIGELGRLQREIGIRQPGKDDAMEYSGFSEADVKARAADQGAAFVERDCRRSNWREVPE